MIARFFSTITLYLLCACYPVLGATVPAGLESSRFSGPDITPCPACLCVAATGEVFVGVDLNGSLGKGAGKGRVVRLVDSDHDGEADSHTVFAEIDNPRGLISMGSKLFVLHTVIPADSGILQAMHLSVLEDADWDGVADGPPVQLISNISVPKHNQDRGADHTTNGIAMGIDGWIYVAVGDFGFVGAKGADGKEITMLGGGVVRVRPDGSGFEVYTHGLRNIYDVAIDPYMNLFTRGNTNDGGGWNVRFIHHVQSGEYGYPVLFKNFTDEILPALVDVGGGSGTGALYFHEPGWPAEFSDVPMMCDWGRSHLYIHRLEPDGATFTQEQESFIKLAQISDVDVDGSGALYLGAWDGAGYKGSPNKGFVERVVPEGWSYKAFPDLGKIGNAELVAMLRSPSAKARLHAQQEILTRPADKLWRAVAAVAIDAGAPLYSRLAAIFTYKQMRGVDANEGLAKLVGDADVREWALRALADRDSKGVGIAKFVEALGDENPRVQVAAAVGLGRLGDRAAAPALLAKGNPPAGTRAPEDGEEGPHATPNAAVVLPHVAVRALVELGASEACLAAVGGDHSDAALWALRSMHEPSVVDGLISKFGTVSAGDPDLRGKILSTLVRLYQKEAPYDGSWWWGTRPDTRGPYYKLATWEGTPKIASFIAEQYGAAGEEEKVAIGKVLARHRAEIPGVAVKVADSTAGKGRAKKVNLKKIAAKKGQIGKMSIEDVILAIGEVKGSARRGKKLFTQQGCMACHTTDSTQPLKGPYIRHVGNILSRYQISESILPPNSSTSPF
ncbi:MAG: DUF7133 domain-containing protein, partial [Verrucomicrobiales bacterium]